MSASAFRYGSAIVLSVFLCGARPQAVRMTADDYYWRGKEKYHNGDFAGAVQEYDKAAKLAPDVARIFGSRGAAKRKLGDKEGALEDARKAARLGDRDAQRILGILGYSWDKNEESRSGKP
ncbi:MAG: tetratricopeptide repeat protein [Chlorobiaceae bacterium]|nr:tetratricopeptide repeat protein [Chlorobiaceae bacterium]NTV60981.1 tetratricopeptide repeat protein [Chlorobiaceae bacterium]